MDSSKNIGEAPQFRPGTIVATALSFDRRGELAHLIVSHGTGPADVELIYVAETAPKTKR